MILSRVVGSKDSFMSDLREVDREKGKPKSSLARRNTPTSTCQKEPRPMQYHDHMKMSHISAEGSGWQPMTLSPCSHGSPSGGSQVAMATGAHCCQSVPRQSMNILKKSITIFTKINICYRYYLTRLLLP